MRSKAAGLPDLVSRTLEECSTRGRFSIAIGVTGMGYGEIWGKYGDGVRVDNTKCLWHFVKAASSPDKEILPPVSIQVSLKAAIQVSTYLP